MLLKEKRNLSRHNEPWKQLSVIKGYPGNFGNNNRFAYWTLACALLPYSSRNVG